MKKKVVTRRKVSRKKPTAKKRKKSLKPRRQKQYDMHDVVAQYHGVVKKGHRHKSLFKRMKKVAEHMHKHRKRILHIIELSAGIAVGLATAGTGAAAVYGAEAAAGVLAGAGAETTVMFEAGGAAGAVQEAGATGGLFTGDAWFTTAGGEATADNISAGLARQSAMNSGGPMNSLLIDTSSEQVGGITGAVNRLRAMGAMHTSNQAMIASGRSFLSGAVISP